MGPSARCRLSIKATGSSWLLLPYCGGDDVTGQAGGAIPPIRPRPGRSFTDG
jgi:hypothetical protein